MAQDAFSSILLMRWGGPTATSRDGPSRWRHPVAALALVALAWQGTLLALEVRIREMRTAGESVRASIDLRDALSDTLRRVLESGSPLHARVQAEVWEDRPLWDNLVRPALVSVFRIVRDPATSQITVSDAVGTLMSFGQWPDPLTLRVEIVPTRDLRDDDRYYLRIVATIGTIAERDIDNTSAAVFGRDDGSISLGTVGRLVFRSVLQMTDYIQSVTAETRSARFFGRDTRK